MERTYQVLSNIQYHDVQSFRKQQEVISWKDLQKIYGWYWFKGSGLVPFYYVRPRTDGTRYKNRTEMLSNGTFMHDYFVKEIDAVDYFIKNNDTF